MCIHDLKDSMVVNKNANEILLNDWLALMKRII